ncbi:MAG: DNA translocase FtsK 4TM domain-containing protein [Muribaculaceae bacterium]|nr:DNA translocase FtsK 4TM domain-containing protein [Muribaculaceae bacterium]
MKTKDNQDFFHPDISGVQKSEDYRKRQEVEQAIDKENVTKWQRFLAFFQNGRLRFVTGILMLMTGIYLLISFLSFFLSAGMSDQNRITNYSMIENAQVPDQIRNAGAAVGASLSDFFIASGVGVAAFIIVAWFLTLGMRLVRKGKKAHFFQYTFVCLFSILTFSMMVGAATYFMKPITFFPLGGYFGFYANKWLLGLLGLYGMIAVNLALFMLWCFLTYQTFNALYQQIQKGLDKKRSRNKEDAEKVVSQPGQPTFLGEEQRIAEESPKTDSETKVSPVNRIRRSRNRSQQTDVTKGETAHLKPIAASTDVSNPHDPTGEYRHYRFPSLDLLQDIRMNPNSVDKQEQDENKERIRDTLSKYGIEIKEIMVHVGPTVTLFEIVPQDGVRVNKIRGLEDDIALSLAALGIRIIAPMPGKGTIGIEVPNRDPQVVPMREVLGSRAFQESRAKLPMCLGCTVSNEVFIADLTKMPHLLVAGATGKGKSVGLNAIITSLLYKKGPSELKFVLVDPKRVEFSVYADLEKYYFAKAPGEEKAIITDTDRVIKTLNCLVQEMEDRYRVFEDVRVRNVADYNEMWRRELREVRDEHGEKKYHYMPYIVGIIDEFSDMIMTAGKEVETPLVRIAQKARAVGIHMIIATQRPSSKVITGLIKGNFPGRIAFAVAQRIDSQIIIDRTGAQQLIGRGDMLFQIDGELTRLQCPFVDTPDIVRICDFIKDQEDKDRDISHEEPYMLPEYVGKDEGGGSDANVGNVKDRDPLFEEAVKFVVMSNTASTSSLQRRYEIGYNRAGRLMDQMEHAGIVGPAQGSKPRQVLVSPMDIDQLFT